MLTALGLRNFKAFADPQKLPLKPLTLIFGPNSAGKSSLIHGLILAHHAINASEEDENRLDVHRTAIGGESVDLGGFRQYIYKRDAARRQVEWSADLDVAQLKGRVAELLASVNSITVLVKIELKHVEKTKPQTIISPRTSEPETVEVPTGELIPQGTPHVSSYEIIADNHSLLRASRQPSGDLQLDRLEYEHPIFQTLVKALVLSKTTTESLSQEDVSIVNEAISELVPEITLRAGSFLPAGLRRSDEFSGMSSMAMLMPISRENRKEDLKESVRSLIPFNLNELISGLNDSLRDELNRIQYLGPLRSYPPRHLAFAQHHDPNWYAGGGYAWDEVRVNEKVREAVNNWLGSSERLQTRYRLEVRRLFDIEELRGPLPQKIYEYDTKKREMVFRDIKELLETSGLKEEKRKEIQDELLTRWQDLDLTDDEIENFDDAKELEEIADRATETIESVNELSLIDLRTGTKVSHRDVGIGVSQVLPVLVGAYASRQKIIAIEQPEIHLHPMLQAELGDLFIESALGEHQNTFLLETHSEHLILRILRRIRETAEGELEEGLMPIRPQDVQVVYAKPTSRGTVLHQLPVTEEGEFAVNWPDGFFPERAKELF